MVKLKVGYKQLWYMDINWGDLLYKRIKTLNVTRKSNIDIAICIKTVKYYIGSTHLRPFIFSTYKRWKCCNYAFYITIVIYIVSFITTKKLLNTSRYNEVWLPKNVFSWISKDDVTKKCVYGEPSTWPFSSIFISEIYRGIVCEEGWLVVCILKYLWSIVTRGWVMQPHWWCRSGMFCT